MGFFKDIKRIADAVESIDARDARDENVQRFIGIEAEKRGFKMESMAEFQRRLHDETQLNYSKECAISNATQEKLAERIVAAIEALGKPRARRQPKKTPDAYTARDVVETPEGPVFARVVPPNGGIPPNGVIPLEYNPIPTTGDAPPEWANTLSGSILQSDADRAAEETAVAESYGDDPDYPGWPLHPEHS